jgi:hypothetical protein
MCNILLFSAEGAQYTLIFSAENSMLRMTLIRFFLYTAFLSAEHFAVSASFSARNSALFQVQYPSLLEHYTTQTNLLVVKGYLTRTYNILFHKEQEKYSIHVHWEQHTVCKFPPYQKYSSIIICTGIASHYGTTPDREQYTLSSTSSLRIGIYIIFNSVPCFKQKHGLLSVSLSINN